MSFSMFKNYHIDGNKEMTAFGIMNIAGSMTSCYLTTGPFSRTAVNYNAGCKTAMSNVVMAIAVMIILLFLTLLFHYTPLVVLASIIISAMLGLIDYEATVHLWHVDKVDFCVCIGSYFGVFFGSVEIGLVLAVMASVLRILLFIARPRTTVLGNIQNSAIYRRMDQYKIVQSVPGVFILQIDAPIYFANASYLRERISRWIDEEEDRIKMFEEASSLQYVIHDMGAVPSIDTSGISMLEELKKSITRRGLQVENKKRTSANPGSEVMKKLDRSKILENIGQEWIFLTVAKAVGACSFFLHTCQNDECMSDLRVSFEHRSSVQERVQVRLDDTEWCIPFEILNEDTVTIVLRKTLGDRRFISADIHGYDEGSRFSILFRPEPAHGPIRNRRMHLTVQTKNIDGNRLHLSQAGDRVVSG